MNTLHLNLKKKWFDMILNGEKREEYRDIKPHWITRLLWIKEEIEDITYFAEELINTDNINHLLRYNKAQVKQFKSITFTNGYAKNAPRCVIQCKGIRIGAGHTIWGADENKRYFVIDLGDVIDKEHIK